jgi:hypothetical protein
MQNFIDKLLFVQRLPKADAEPASAASMSAQP